MSATLVQNRGLFQLYIFDSRLIVRGRVDLVDDKIMRCELGGFHESDEEWSFDTSNYMIVIEYLADVIVYYNQDKLSSHGE